MISIFARTARAALRDRTVERGVRQIRRYSSGPGQSNPESGQSNPESLLKDFAIAFMIGVGSGAGSALVEATLRNTQVQTQEVEHELDRGESFHP